MKKYAPYWTPGVLIGLLLFAIFTALDAGAQSKQPGKAGGKAPTKSIAAGSPSADWPELRGPNRDGSSPEKNLPEKWSLHGENLLWRVEYGSISGPVVLGDRVYLNAPVGKGPTLQEHVISFDANTGKIVWDRPITIVNSDVPPHRIAWAPPTADPETGNVYALSANGALSAFSRDGKPLWTRYMTEEFGMITTHGGRTAAPLVEGDLVIAYGLTFNWGDQARGASRIYAFDKRNGQVRWMSNPGARPTDTTYAPMIVATINGVRELVVGLSDGAMHAVKLGTGEPLWHYDVSKRGLNTGALAFGNNVLISHSEENLETNEMGMLALADGTGKGAQPLKQMKWLRYNVQVGYGSPTTDGKTIYTIDNGALLAAADAATGNELWTKKLGTIQKANLVYADGKLYFGTESGRFYIVRPKSDGCDVLSDVSLGTTDDPEQVLGGAAVARGRVYFASKKALYAIGKKGSTVPPWKAGVPGPGVPASGAPAWLQVVPADAALHAGDTVKFRARLYTTAGEFIKEADAQWSLDQLSGEMQQSGAFTAPADTKGQAGKVKAVVDGVGGEARVRVIPPLPWSYTFEDYAVGSLPGWWVNAAFNKFAVKEIEGNKVLTKLADNTFSFIKRARLSAGAIDWSNYTTEADIRLQMKRRQMGDGGISAQGYLLLLFGNHDRAELQSWEPETQRTVTAPFPVKPDTWYHLKLRVQNLPDGSVHAQGKVWPTGEPEPAQWMLDRTDRAGYGVMAGPPGIYGDAINEVYFDNYKVYKNQ
jgi:outer membrane protein assembly factor BamB